MNLSFSKLIRYKNKNVKIKYINDCVVIENKTSKPALLFFNKLFKNENKAIQTYFEGKIVDGEAAVLMILNRKREIMAETTLNSKMIYSGLIKYFIVVLKVFPNTTVEIKNVSLNYIDYREDSIVSEFNNDILVVTPSYPSEEHKYLSGFVHSRVVEYKKNGINVDVAVVYDYKNISSYEFEGIKAVRMSYIHLRTLLQRKKYKKILVHFFDKHYFNVFQGVDLSSTQMFIWIHGPETLHWDYPYYMTKYFEPYREIPDSLKQEFIEKDKMLKLVNEKNNVKWIFVSNWIKNRSEELLGFKFNNYEVIPNIIDVDLFKYRKKDSKTRKKIFILRRFDDMNKYAVDVSVRTILELSKRKIFDELEFNIYGNGDAFDKLFNPIMKFDNVHFFKSFYTHEKIAELHKENGIALFPTRYDAQGVSMCESGSSGLLVVSSNNDAIKEFIPSKDGNIIDTEDYIKYADFIENIVNNPKLFDKICKDTRAMIENKCSYENTVQKEISFLKRDYKLGLNIEKTQLVKNPVLTVVIPAYNVSQYIENTLVSLIKDNKNSKYVEILVVNDGSKDDTSLVVNDFINKYCDNDKPTIRLIDKENGGHGSTINRGIEEAKGKYLRIIDGDDWVNTKDFEKLIQELLECDSDIVVTNYSEDYLAGNRSDLMHRLNYEIMVPGYKYNFDDLCIENYGFKHWGPILATANILTEKLREANFKLSEKTFYVDMEFNSFYLPVINSITYYNLDVYRYFIGRDSQSISVQSFVRNISHHEKVIKNILQFLYSADLSSYKRRYIYNNIVYPMIQSHYDLLLDTIRKSKKFKSFDNMLYKILSKDDYKKVCKNNRIRILRKTNGVFINLFFYLVCIKKFLKR